MKKVQKKQPVKQPVKLSQIERKPVDIAIGRRAKAKAELEAKAKAVRHE